MTDQPDRVTYLLHQYAGSLCTEAEMEELFASIRASQDNEALHHFLEEEWIKMQPPISKTEPDWDRVYQTIMTSDEQPKTIPLYRRPVFKYIAAASIILLLGLGALVTLRDGVTLSPPKGPTVATQPNDVPAPANTRAVITLADGSKLYLDSAGNGTIANESGVQVVKNSEGEIVYSSEGVTLSPGVYPEPGRREGSQLSYNTLFNPRGSKVISLTLSDGTKVWLNSESSLKYPTAFTGNTREVEITGEAYFEVTKMSPAGGGELRNLQNRQRPGVDNVPFIVKKGDVSVTVLGTHFNVNAYDDEDAVRVTLLEGSVAVTLSPSKGRSDGRTILKPGQQAVYSANSQQLTANSSVDLESTIAWKTGMFLLDNTDLATIMRQVSRWYDVDVVFEGPVSNKKFGGGVSKNLPLSKLLELLEANGIHFRLEGKKLTVLK